MALSAEHRSILYTEFVDRLGPDVTEAFLAAFPAREGDEPVTRDFLRAELSVTRGELRGEMADLRGQLRGEMANLRNDLHGEMAQVQLAVAALDARIARSEAAFQKESKRQLAVIGTAILGTGTAVLAGMAVSVAVIVSRVG